MKKLLLFAAIMLVSTAAAQEIQVQSKNDSYKFAIENIESKNKHTLYMYGELISSSIDSSYTQVFYEYNLGVVSTHVEYRNLLVDNEKLNHTYIAGLSACVLSNSIAYVSISPLYRFDNRHMWQLSAVYQFSYKNVVLSGYFDVYGANCVNAFSENKLKLYIGRCFVGANAEFVLYKKYAKLTPYFLAGFRF